MKKKKSKILTMTKYTYSALLNQYNQDAPVATEKESLPSTMTPYYTKQAPGIYHFKVERDDEDILLNCLPFVGQGFTGFTNKVSTRNLDLGVYIYVEKWNGTEYVPMDGEMPADTSFKVEFWIEE